MTTIRLPANGWIPRPDQREVWDYFETGGKHAVVIAHRRYGKDDVGLHMTAVLAHQRIGTYWHMLPTQTQAARVIWDAVNPHTGKRRIDEAFPQELRSASRRSDFTIELRCGSVWQLVGSDNYNQIVGAPPIGLIFSEWALSDPSAFGYLRPILAENDGWALFITTPRGRNHAHRFYRSALEDPDQLAILRPATETPVFSDADLERERAEYLKLFGPDDGDLRFRQEYLCDFTAAIPGAYFARYMTAAEEEGRVARVPWEPQLEVHVSWDLGFGDSTALWFCQVAGREVRLIDYYESSGVGIEHYVKHLREKSYVYGDMILPHDAGSGSIQTGMTTIETLVSLGMRPERMRLLKRAESSEAVEQGINAARNLIPRCWFDQQRCERGIEALMQYRREWDEKHRAYKRRPLHDWCSDAADSFRYLAQGLPDITDYGVDYDWRDERAEYDRNSISGY